MKLTTLAMHTVDLDLLPDVPRVLDVGCRDWDFSTAILAERPCGSVVALDPAPDIEAGAVPPRVSYLRMALVGDDRGGSSFAHYSTGHGDCLAEFRSPADAEMLRVPCVNITRLMKARFVERWDVVKLDCEGAEFQILEMWPGPIATQISVEFHDYADPSLRDGPYYRKLFACMAKLGYRVVQHEISGQGPHGTAKGHWDSLLTL
jgi:FkbM family methyltransferase